MVSKKFVLRSSSGFNSKLDECVLPQSYPVSIHWHPVKFYYALPLPDWASDEKTSEASSPWVCTVVVLIVRFEFLWSDL